MPAFPSVLLKKGIPLEKEEEIAYLVADRYARLLGDGLRGRLKARKWAYSLWAIGAACFLALPAAGPSALAAGAVSILTGFGLYLYWRLNRSRGRIRRIGHVHWCGWIAPFEDGGILVDLSDYLRNTQFSIPYLEDGAARMEKLHDRFEKATGGERLVLSRREDAHEGELELQKEETELVEALRSTNGLMSEIRQVSVSLPVFNGENAIVEELRQQREHLVAGGNAPVLRNLRREEAAKRVERLKQLTMLDRGDSASAHGAGSFEETCDRYVESCARGLETFDDDRETSLLKIMNQSLRKIRFAFRLPIFNYYCPHCADAGEGEAGSEGEGLVSGFAAEQESLQKRDELVRHGLLRLETDRKKPVWKCSQCGQVLAPKEAKKILKIKDDLVFPVWDQLWTELHVPRNEITQRKETELRGNKNEESKELQALGQSFDAFRSKLEDRINQLKDEAEEAIDKVESLVSEFEQFKLLNPEAAEEYRRFCREQEEKGVVKSREILRELERIQGELDAAPEAVFTQRTDIIDYVNEVRNDHLLIDEDEQVVEV